MIYGGEFNEQGGDLLNLWVCDWDGNGVLVQFNMVESGWVIIDVGGCSIVCFYEFENFFIYDGCDMVSVVQVIFGEDNCGIQFNMCWGNDMLVGLCGNDMLEVGDGVDMVDGGCGDDFILLVQDFLLLLGSYVQLDVQCDVLVVCDGVGFDIICVFQFGDLCNGVGQIVWYGDVLNLQGLYNVWGDLVGINDVCILEFNGYVVLSFLNGEWLFLENICVGVLIWQVFLGMGFEVNFGVVLVVLQQWMQLEQVVMQVCSILFEGQGGFGLFCKLGVFCFIVGMLIDIFDGFVVVEML